MANTQGRKTVIITGATSGIGLETARALLDAGMYVIGTGRSQEKCERAIQELTGGARDSARDSAHAARIDFIIADLSSQREVREAARAAVELLQEKSGSRLDVLINNAGTVAGRRIETEDGRELQWAVNHLAPFLFSHQLLPFLLKGHEARLITVSSRSHRGASIHWKDPDLHRGYNPLRAYGQSKLANVLFTCQLNRLLGPGSPLRAFAADPGLVRTEIGYKNTSGIIRLIWTLRRRAAVAPSEGAATSVFLATAPRESLECGSYWRNRRPAAPSAYARNVKTAERLWRMSEEMCAISYDDFLPGVL
ncbi:MAG: SDR family NAD(P)-dependent oxidoreductase [Spirochaetota bacterium]|nr:SDR family NAD(P)-dependent oxidoreductase [Spirochaetota bacterium]